MIGPQFKKFPNFSNNFFPKQLFQCWHRPRRASLCRDHACYCPFDRLRAGDGSICIGFCLNSIIFYMTDIDLLWQGTTIKSLVNLLKIAKEEKVNGESLLFFISIFSVFICCIFTNVIGGGDGVQYERWGTFHTKLLKTVVVILIRRNGECFVSI